MEAETKENASVKDLMVFKAREHFQALMTNFRANMILKGIANVMYRAIDVLLLDTDM